MSSRGPSTVRTYAVPTSTMPELGERVLLKLRTAVGNGDEHVNLQGTTHSVLGVTEVRSQWPCTILHVLSPRRKPTAQIKVLTRMLLETEADAKGRERAQDVARRALEKARESDQAPTFNAFLLDKTRDAEASAWEAACDVVWPDDPVLAQDVNAFESAGDGAGRQLSYRFTPRSQREDMLGARKKGTGVGRHSVGRARVPQQLEPVATATLPPRALRYMSCSTCSFARGGWLVAPRCFSKLLSIGTACSKRHSWQTWSTQAWPSKRLAQVASTSTCRAMRSVHAVLRTSPHTCARRPPCRLLPSAKMKLGMLEQRCELGTRQPAPKRTPHPSPSRPLPCPGS